MGFVFERKAVSLILKGDQFLIVASVDNPVIVYRTAF